MGRVGEEIRRRVPRLTMSLVLAIIFWIISAIVPPTVSNIPVPGIDTNAGFLIWVVTIIIAAVFVIRALSDALFLGDIVTDIIVRRLGIKEERSPKRAARDLIYIIVIILIATAILPVIDILGGNLKYWLKGSSFRRAPSQWARASSCSPRSGAPDSAAMQTET